jgi:hypothetical protein
MLTTSLHIKEQNSYPEMEGTGKSHGQFRLKNFLEHKERSNLDPTYLKGIFGVSKEIIRKVTEAMVRMNELYCLFGFCYEPKPQAWIDKKKKKQIMNLRDLQRVILSSHVYDKTTLSILEYVKNEGKHSWVGLLKWKFAAFFSAHNSQEIPTRPWKGNYTSSFFNPHNLLGGPYHDFYYQLKSTDKECFQNTVLLGLKKGAPRVTKSMINESVFKTTTALTTSILPESNKKISLPTLNEHDLPQWEDHEDMVVTQQDMIREIKRTVLDMFKGESMKFLKMIKPSFPSTSSNYINNRAGLGAVGTFYDQFRSKEITYKTDDESSSSRRMDKEKKHFTVIYPKRLYGIHDSGIDFGVSSCELKEHQSSHYGTLGTEENESFSRSYQKGLEPTEYSTILEADVSDLHNKFMREYWDMWNKAKTEIPLVEPVGLAEPLKVRVISKGPPNLYTVLKPLQRFMHTVLRQHKTFSLIGTPLTTEFINELLPGLKNKFEVVSGDYAAATDNLYSYATEAAVDQLIEIFADELFLDDNYPANFIVDLRQLLLNSLTRHVFELNDAEGNPIPGYHDQKNGQLMGSITSFPFLCLINAAVCRYAKEVSERRILRVSNFGKHDWCHIAINGDDCLFDGPIGRIRPLWEACSSLVGLKSSVGKTYFSTNTCTVNSRVFRFRKGLWNESPFINFGLLLGLKKSVVIQDRSKAKKVKKVQQDDKVPLHKMGQFLRDLKKTCPEHLWLKVKKRFVYYNFDKLGKTTLPWFLPEWVGGLGLPNDGELGDLDRKLAEVIKRNFNKLKPISMSEAPMWQMHKLVEKEFSQFRVPKTFSKLFVKNEKTYKVDKQYEELYSYTTVSLLYSKEIEDLVKIVDEDSNIKKALRHNEKIFWKAQRVLGTGNYPPMDDTNLASEVKHSFIPCLIGNRPLTNMVPFVPWGLNPRPL